MYYNPDRLKLNDWLNDPQVPKGCTQKELGICGDFNNLYRRMNVISIICFFMCNELGMRSELQTLFSSVERQKSFIRAVRARLHERRVNAKYDPVFKREMGAIERRYEYAFKMVCENLRMTEYYPFFQNKGFKLLRDNVNLYRSGDEEAMKRLLSDILEYNKAHPDEISMYMESIKDEKEAMERHRAKIKEDERREKAEVKAERDRQREFDKETKKIRKEQQRRDRKIERSFEKYYSGRN